MAGPVIPLPSNPFFSLWLPTPALGMHAGIPKGTLPRKEGKGIDQPEDGHMVSELTLEVGKPCGHGLVAGKACCHD